MVDSTEAYGYKYKYSYKCFEDVGNQEQMEAYIMQRGQKKQIIYKGEQQKIYYYVAFFNEHYHWLFENQEPYKKLIATYTFVLNNLQIVKEQG